MSLYVCLRCQRIENTAGANLFTQRRAVESGQQAEYPLCKPCAGITDYLLNEYLTVPEYEAKYGHVPGLWNPPA